MSLCVSSGQEKEQDKFFQYEQEFKPYFRGNQYVDFGFARSCCSPVISQAIFLKVRGRKVSAPWLQLEQYVYLPVWHYQDCEFCLIYCCKASQFYTYGDLIL